MCKQLRHSPNQQASVMRLNRVCFVFAASKPHLGLQAALRKEPLLLLSAHVFIASLICQRDLPTSGGRGTTECAHRGKQLAHVTLTQPCCISYTYTQAYCSQALRSSGVAPAIGHPTPLTLFPIKTEAEKTGSLAVHA